MLRLVRDGIAINRHYRKITPMVADELARWGDWANATWIWESVISSRPYVVAILSNIARGYASTGNPVKALDYLERARTIQPDAPAVRSLEVILLSRTGQDARALALAREAIAANVADYDLFNATFLLASRTGDYPLAANAMTMRIAGWPENRVSGYLQLGNLYATSLHSPEQALESYHRAVELTPPDLRAGLQGQIPTDLWQALGLAASTPPVSTQMSVISK